MVSFRESQVAGTAEESTQGPSEGASASGLADFDPVL